MSFGGLVFSQFCKTLINYAEIQQHKAILQVFYHVCVEQPFENRIRRF